jgi:RimJ/RimL family protein N-acetyltransferase
MCIRDSYTTEAAGALLNWAFSDPSCQAVTAGVTNNNASIRVLEKIGMKRVVEEEMEQWIITRQQQLKGHFQVQPLSNRRSPG